MWYIRYKNVINTKNLINIQCINLYTIWYMIQKMQMQNAQKLLFLLCKRKKKYSY